MHSGFEPDTPLFFLQILTINNQTIELRTWVYPCPRRRHLARDGDPRSLPRRLRAPLGHAGPWSNRRSATRKASLAPAMPSRSPSGSPTRRATRICASTAPAWSLEKSDFAAEPAVVCSEKDIAILHIQFSSSSPNINAAHRRHQPGQHQHFVYKADHEHPSLDLLPVPSPICYGSDEFDLLPGADGEDGYRIAVLRQHRLAPLGTGDYEYDLHNLLFQDVDMEHTACAVGAEGHGCFPAVP